MIILIKMIFVQSEKIRLIRLIQHAVRCFYSTTDCSDEHRDFFKQWLSWL